MALYLKKKMNRVRIIKGCFLPSLVKIGSVLLEKIFNTLSQGFFVPVLYEIDPGIFLNDVNFFSLLLYSAYEKGRGSSFKQT